MDILKQIDEYLESVQPESRQHLGASQIGHACRRKIWYAFRWARIPKLSARTIRIFDRGNREEAIFRGYLRSIGIKVLTKSRRTNMPIGFSDFGAHFSGTVDAMIKVDDEWMVVDFKTMNEKSFKQLSKKTIKDVKLEYFIQLQIYMHYMKVKKALYFAVNKNNDDLYEEFINYDRDQALYYVDRANRIIRSKEPLERISEDPSWYLCAMCEFRSICHGKDEFTRNCRTCSHVTPEVGNENKVWVCGMDSKKLAFSYQKEGCDKYEVITQTD